jgi:hypothetical protein
MHLSQQPFGFRRYLGPEKGSDIEYHLPVMLARRALEFQEHVSLLLIPGYLCIGGVKGMDRERIDIHGIAGRMGFADTTPHN